MNLNSRYNALYGLDEEDRNPMIEKPIEMRNGGQLEA